MCNFRFAQSETDPAEHRVNVRNKTDLPNINEFRAQALDGFQRCPRLSLRHLYPRQQAHHGELDVWRAFCLYLAQARHEGEQAL
ncbi:hypothetical protein SDC9_199418 [bioreactor metagenome]|uniref:Uncharacterized protein n=1 Tax=bioreactor metagenome TaxID=1076179 RepID=A0A645IMR2_9ZZZZ